MNIAQIQLQDQNGKHCKLSDFGKLVLLYVYPKDNTPGCTIENRDYSKRREEFLALGIEPIGVSADSIESHENFCSMHGLKNTLLSDPDMKLISALGAYGKKNLYGRIFNDIMRSTFLINTEMGDIIYSWERVRVLGHVERVLRDLSSKKIEF